MHTSAPTETLRWNALTLLSHNIVGGDALTRKNPLRTPPQRVGLVCRRTLHLGAHPADYRYHC